MRQKIRQLLLLVVVISLLLFVGYQIRQLSVVNNNGKGISPFPSAFTLNANIYYLNSSSKLENEAKTLVITSNKIVEALFDALKSKPTLNYCYPLIEEDVRILSYDIVDKKLYLNLSKDILTTAYWDRGYHNEIIYAIVNTMTQFETVDRVQVIIAGRDIKTYVDDALNYNNLVYNEGMNQRPKIPPQEVLSLFLTNIQAGDYEGAFKLTTAHQTEMPSKFVDEMLNYVKETENLELGDMLLLDEDGYINISVNYEVFNTEEDEYQMVKVKYWQAYENASKYYIYWKEGVK